MRMIHELFRSWIEVVVEANGCHAEQTSVKDATVNMREKNAPEISFHLPVFR